ncbi:esterase family protein [Paenibacillus wynnii]|uniref:esterase family protein n=1 Tax=Paenibacillus wynnii TaxID=268407 RepID=UPI00278DB01D|nr:alpha/beta hydrolase-fold protein [Paenibacillus wynnii]MDQ0192433.1 esterase/lipase superfamily enzyme [Paenibacillus wynnii]
MKVSYHKEYSHFLHRDMEYKIYGHAGKPMLVFPTSLGRFYQYEDSGMIETLREFIDSGKLQIWACDSIDEETFFSEHWNIEDKINRHEQYDKYISQELIPGILQQSQWNNAGEPQKILISGCSMGGFYSANFFFRHPHFFDSLISLSGVYSTHYFFGDYREGAVYLNSPLHYLPQLQDDHYLNQYRQSRIIICCGQGAYEDEMLHETRLLQEILQHKHIPAQIDYWGTDVNHDWDWWNKQIHHYMSSFLTI